jgi:hypothetical protein
MGDETRDVTAIKLLMRNERQYRRLYVLGFVTEPAHSGMQPALLRNERQYRRLYVLGFVTEPAHSGMQPALPIPVETLAPP